jgi:hypothetical protein
MCALASLGKNSATPPNQTVNGRVFVKASRFPLATPESDYPCAKAQTRGLIPKKRQRKHAADNPPGAIPALYRCFLIQSRSSPSNLAQHIRLYRVAVIPGDLQALLLFVRHAHTRRPGTLCCLHIGLPLRWHGAPEVCFLKVNQSRNVACGGIVAPYDRRPEYL